MSVSYDGSAFNGFQKQVKLRSVEEEINNVLTKMHKHEVKIVGAGRTDKDVHALGQVFHFDSGLKITCDGVKKGLNALLPSDIYVNKVESVDEDFHARFSAIGKKYVYKMVEGENNPILNKLVYFYEGVPLDFEKMLQTKELFIGTHNFMNFCSNKDEESYDETIYSIDIKRVNNEYTFTFIGSGFKRYMVRILVGTMLAVAKGKYTLEQVKEKLESKVHQNVSFKVPPVGLYLEKVYYEGDELL